MANPELEPAISTGAVAKATGKPWDEWFRLLDQAGANEWDHKQIVAYMNAHFGDEISGWWQQSITVAYEKAHGKRMLGETAGAGFQIGVQKTLPMSAEELWRFLFSERGLSLWLHVRHPFKPEPTCDFTTEDGIRGRIRTVDPGKKIRLTWQRSDWSEPSTLQIYLLPVRETATSLRFHQEKLADQAIRQEMKGHWQQVLAALASAIER
jgi:uncharacterized protein YndB with AHSA1/START domain